MSIRLKLSGAFLWWLTAVPPGHAQDNGHPGVLVAEHPTDKRVLPCRAGTNFEGVYKIKTVTVDDPFKFLYWIGARRDSVEAQLKENLSISWWTGMRSSSLRTHSSRPIPKEALWSTWKWYLCKTVIPSLRLWT
jgi:hypothetical protein